MNALGFCSDPFLHGQMPSYAPPYRKSYRTFDVINQSVDHYIEQANSTQITPSGDHNQTVREMMAIHFQNSQFGG